MKYILLSIFTIGILTSCDPKSNYIDTGISNGKHDCSMLEYFHTSSYNWDSLLVMIQHAELESLLKAENRLRTNHVLGAHEPFDSPLYARPEITRISDME